LRLGLIYGDPQTWNYNADGFLITILKTDNSYVQVFRDCGIEAFDISLQFNGLDSKDDQLKVAFGVNIERPIINALKRYQDFWNLIGVPGPIGLSLTLMGAKGCAIVHGHIDRSNVIAIDRDCLMTSDAVIDDLSTPAEIALKPLFDFIWNASGYRELPHYKDEKWSEKISN
jgi:hypothetical protein